MRAIYLSRNSRNFMKKNRLEHTVVTDWNTPASGKGIRPENVDALQRNWICRQCLVGLNLRCWWYLRWTSGPSDILRYSPERKQWMERAISSSWRGLWNVGTEIDSTQSGCPMSTLAPIAMSQSLLGSIKRIWNVSFNPLIVSIYARVYETFRAVKGTIGR